MASVLVMLSSIK